MDDSIWDASAEDRGATFSIPVIQRVSYYYSTGLADAPTPAAVVGNQPSTWFNVSVECVPNLR